MRVSLLIGSFGILYLFLIFNLYNLQFNKNSYYEAKAESQELATGILEPLRGNIYFTDKNGNQVLAALDKNFPLIYAVPKEIEDPQKTADQLSNILGISGENLLKGLQNKKSLYYPVLFKATDEQVGNISGLNIKGIYIKNQTARYYPFGSLASNLLGFVSPAQNNNGLDQGQYGIEAYFNKELSGSMGDLNGDKITSSADGSDIHLTVDPNIQDQAEETLKKIVDQWSAVGGDVIVEDPNTGKILTMASYPNFDPNNYSQSQMSNFINPNVQLLYEPGSVFKILTMAAGIDTNKITPDTTYYDTGLDIINGKKIHDWDNKAHGLQTMTDVIVHSLNLGTIFAEKTMGHEIFTDYVKKFGMGDLTGIQLPGEVSGNLQSLRNGRDVNYATASFGQGIAITPIEMITAASAIANGGLLMKPIIRENEQPEVIRRVISEDTAKKVTQMMVKDVVENVLAAIPNYNIAGKSGTAYIPDLKHGGYTSQVIDSFIGFAPAINPKFIVLIRLDAPKGAPLSGTAVVPGFRELTDFILNYYNVAPDNINK